jgi:hypothetical protein
MKVTDNSIQVFLQLNTGVFTRKMFIPKHCLREYRLPLLTHMSVHAINITQEAYTPEKTKAPVLVFSATGKEQQGTPIMELIRIDN